MNDIAQRSHAGIGRLWNDKRAFTHRHNQLCCAVDCTLPSVVACMAVQQEVIASATSLDAVMADCVGRRVQGKAYDDRIDNM